MQLYLPIAELPLNLFLLLGMGGAIGFISGLFGVGGGFLLRAGGQGQTQGQGDQQLVDAHDGMFLVVKGGNAPLRAANMMTSPCPLSSGRWSAS
jgi:hypothetical protein